MYFEAKCPGSLMLWGEHLVLFGAKAIVASIDKFITIRLIPLSEKKIYINDNYVTDIAAIMDCAEYSYVLAVIKSFAKLYTTGFRLDISSDIPKDVGFASSAACTVATLQVINKFLQLDLPEIALWQHAKAITAMLGKAGSGADLAASIWPGVLVYDQDCGLIEKLQVDFGIVPIYAGYKTETIKVIELVKKNTPLPILVNLANFSDSLLPELLQCLKAKNWYLAGKYFNIYNGILDSLSVVSWDLHQIAQSLRLLPGIYGAKVSGAGLGDCVVGLGEIQPYECDESFRYIKVKIYSTKDEISSLCS